MQPCWGKSITRRELWEFTTSPHFQFTLCFLCVIEEVIFLLWLPAAMSPLPRWTHCLDNKLFLLLSFLWVLALYHSNRKVTNVRPAPQKKRESGEGLSVLVQREGLCMLSIIFLSWHCSCQHQPSSSLCTLLVLHTAYLLLNTVSHQELGRRFDRHIMST